MDNNKYFIYLILAIISVFYFSTIRDGHYWGDDFSMYIRHAINIVEGRPYSESGYIYNKFRIVAPRSYPPVLPILLSPFYMVFGFNINAFKIPIIISFVCLLYILYLSFKNELRYKYMIFLILVIGFNPFLWDYKDNILSEFPFVCFLYLSLYVINKFYTSENPRPLIKGIICGILTAITFGTRSIGIVLIPSLLINDLIRAKKLSKFFIATTTTFLILAILKTTFIKGELDYFDIMSSMRINVVENIYDYIKSMASLWYSGKSIGSIIILLVSYCFFSLLFLVGIVKRIRQGLSIYEIYIVLYTITIILWPHSQGARFLIPIIPLYFFYSITAMTSFKTEKYVFVIAMIIISLAYTKAYLNANFGPIPYIGSKNVTSLFNFIKENTEESDVIIFRKPRALALFTNRKSSVYHKPEDDKQLWHYIKSIGSRYIILAPKSLDRDGYLEKFINNYMEYFEKIYANEEFAVYKVRKWPFNGDS